MPRYFFDVRSGEALHRDRDGIDLPNACDVWQIVVIMVDDIADAGQHEQLPERVSVIVRNESNAVVYRSDQHGHVRAPDRRGSAIDHRADAASM